MTYRINFKVLKLRSFLLLQFRSGSRTGGPSAGNTRASSTVPPPAPGWDQARQSHICPERLRDSQMISCKVLLERLRDSQMIAFKVLLERLRDLQMIAFKVFHRGCVIQRCLL